MAGPEKTAIKLGCGSGPLAALLLTRQVVTRMPETGGHVQAPHLPESGVAPAHPKFVVIGLSMRANSEQQ
jgi:hypothetical protein